MKKILLALSILLISNNYISAQVTEVEKPMSMGLKNALVTNFKDIKQKKLEDLWEDFMKQFDCKTKKDKKLGEYLSDNAHVYYIVNAPTTDIYARFNELGPLIELSLFFNVNDAFLSSKTNAEQMKGANELMRQFVVFVDKYKTNERLDDEQKALKKDENELKKLAKENESLHKDIENYKEKIRKAEADIVKNQTEQDAANGKITEQAKKVDAVRKQLDALK